MNTAAKLAQVLSLPEGAVVDQTLIMGVLNITPDSFSDGGQFASSEQAYSAAIRLADSGAAIVDIGGESTGPGAKPITAAEELARITPLLQTLPEKVCVSVDTYKAEVAARSAEAGAKIINDVSALRADPKMAETVAAANCHVVLMFSKEADEHPHASFSKRDYGDVVSEVVDFLLARVEVASAAGIKPDKIILDPGMGGFVSREHKYSWELLEKFELLCKKLQPYPVLVGTSRKGFLDVPLAERDPLSAHTATHAAAAGAAIVRVHNVRMTAQFLSVQGKLAGRSN